MPHKKKQQFNRRFEIGCYNFWGFEMDKKIKALLIAALNVADGRTGDVDTEDGSFATTSVENMIALQEAFCDAFNTNSDDVIASEIMPKIAEL